MKHPLRLTGLTCNHGYSVRSGRADDSVEEVVEKDKSISILPKKGSGIAINVSHHQLTELLAFECRKFARLAVNKRHALLC